MKLLSKGLEVINETGKYACATVQYTGLVSYGVLKLGGRAVADSVTKIGRPVARGIAWPFAGMKNMSLKLFRRRAYFDGKFKDVEDKLAHIEQQLASIEQRGVLFRETSVLIESPRRIDPGKRALLRQIVEANMSLMEKE